MILVHSGCSKKANEPIQEWDGTFQKVKFFDALCGKLRPVPVTFSIPSNFNFRHLDLGYGYCIWAAEADLDSVFASRTGDEIDFSECEGGLFQARVSMNVDYNLRTKKFTNEDDFAMQLKSMGMEGEVKRLQYGGCPALLIEATPGPEAPDDMNDTYMLYLAFPHLGYSVLINYRPSKVHSEQNKAIWNHFVENIETTITVEDTNVPDDHNDISTYLDMMKESKPYEESLKVFLPILQSGDVDRIMDILNKSQVEELGEENTRAWLRSELIPFFERFTAISAEGTVTRSGDQRGNPGFAFHMVGASPVSEDQLFVIYILEEDGTYGVGGVRPYERGE